MRHVLTAAVAALGITLLCGPLSARADNGWGSTTCSQSPSPDCNVIAGNRPNHPAVSDQHTQASPNDDANLADTGFGCRHVPVEHHPPDGQPQEPGGWYMVLCSPDGKDPDSHGPVWIPASQTPPALTPQQVAQIAQGQLRLPAPTITASPAGTQLVHLPTWLWLSGGWMPSSATASVPGVSVTAVATPMTVTWSMGDGGTVTCAGPGTPFSTDVDPKSASPDCGHIYRRSSVHEPGQTFRVSATVHWTVTWSGAGQSGTFPDLTTTNSVTFRVAESQALNNGRR